jgi:hypothetical protein
MADLLVDSDYPPLDTAAVAGLLLELEEDKERSITGYRDSAYASVVTGTRGDPGPLPWLLALADPKEGADAV